MRPGRLIAEHLEENNPPSGHIATVANLNKKYGAGIKKADELALGAMPQRLGAEPLYRASLDLAAGLARLARDRARRRQREPSHGAGRARPSVTCPSPGFRDAARRGARPRGAAPR